MKVYEVRDWDPMASSWGAEYVAATHLSRKKAAAHAAKLNADRRAAWPPQALANYHDRAYVREVDVK